MDNPSSCHLAISRRDPHARRIIVEDVAVAAIVLAHILRVIAGQAAAQASNGLAVVGDSVARGHGSSSMTLVGVKLDPVFNWGNTAINRIDPCLKTGPILVGEPASFTFKPRQF